ncbi:MAG: 6-phosphogluconolactonase [Candidatus Scalindua sp. AMX11]|nr:MAG: 6-phosphogluconolactonase [Candidatus Scalindua sp.]NOG82514.1 6-phosphogluconolactonase [Planctomycetota bacterium]RZV93944.1 MAG: 6-phosphogluconolactonase [Candidatus Scalindua sp. SCAELEC01]TDE65564.1 MAG: 6-phosphogluconolactonase [Candidatus Scalindua sp. AMX11]GJQ58149.1 MAG: 6-phosphogluconolactonase [Candidatus Scalindua sp.]
MNRNIRIFPDKRELVLATAEKIVDSIPEAIRKRGVCNIALAGGSTPRDLYALLATEPYKNRICWADVSLFWGDERTVSPDDPESNYRMVRQTLLDHIDIPEKNVHRIRGEAEPREAASEYEKLLCRHFNEELPRFDFVLLGLGDDGHTASLFPGTEVIDEYDQLVAAVFVPKFATWRVTLTLPVLNGAREIIFLVSGESKSDMVKRIMGSHKPDKELPATLVIPQSGKTSWMFDAEAASLLDEGV